MQDFMVATHSVVPCGHMFCGECLSEWLQKNPSCPKCRAAANAPPVRTMAVDNVLESLVEKGMSKEDLQERKQRKQHWEARAATINARMKSLFRHGSHHAPQSGHMPTYHGHHAPHAAMNWEAFAAMHGKIYDSHKSGFGNVVHDLCSGAIVDTLWQMCRSWNASSAFAAC